MKKIFLFLFNCCLGLAAANYPDFAVSDIVTQQDNFIYIKLQNLSNYNVRIKPELKEKIFLTIFINNVKRSEYKLKYINKKLFIKKSSVFFRTNFRIQKKLKNLTVKVQLNRLKIIPEIGYLNNTLSKKLHRNESQ